MGKDKKEEKPDETKVMISSYLEINRAQDLYEKNQNDSRIYDIISNIEGTPVENLLLSGPVTLGLKILEEKQRIKEKMEKTLTYKDLIDKYDNREILGLLGELPLLKKDLKGYEDIAKKHQEYLNSKELMESKEAKSVHKRNYVANYMKNKTDKKSDYYSAFESKDIDALLGGIMLENQREIVETIENYKKKIKN